MLNIIIIEKITPPTSEDQNPTLLSRPMENQNGSSFSELTQKSNGTTRIIPNLSNSSQSRVV